MRGLVLLNSHSTLLHRRPVDSNKLSGRWSLLYQAPTREEDVQNPDTTLEGPLLARLRPVFGGLVRSKVRCTW